MKIIEIIKWIAYIGAMLVFVSFCSKLMQGGGVPLSLLMLPMRRRAVIVDSLGVARIGYFLPALIEKQCLCGKYFKTRRHEQKFHSRICSGKHRGGRRS